MHFQLFFVYITVLKKNMEFNMYASYSHGSDMIYLTNNLQKFRKVFLIYPLTKMA